jgi:glycosyltransferase involved in cell wall biosynthesis
LWAPRSAPGLRRAPRVVNPVDRKRKILWLSDHPLVPSGVGIQAKYAISGLLETGEYQFVCLGGAIKHPDYTPQMVAPEQFGQGSWVIHPVDGHGNKDLLRRFLAQEKPDAVVLFTDPRFFMWVWEMEDEVRAVCPIVYWHVWDNDPIPEFNRPIYDATDHVMALSLKTYGILQGLGHPEDRFSYVPHAEPDDLFKPLPREKVVEARRQNFGPFADREFIVMWNNRNARRKMTGDVIESFARFAKRVGRDRVALLMHTQSDDQEGQDVKACAKKMGIEDILLLSESRVPPEQLNMMYNCADCVINISNNEGFGLGTLEALFAGTPIVVNMTGGLQFQIGDWWQDLTDFSDQEKLTRLARQRKSSHRWWGVPVYPAARNMVGSQQVPYIYDDRINNDDVAAALEKVFKMGPVARQKLGLEAREWALKTFGMKGMIDGWRTGLDKAIAQHSASRGRIGTIRFAAV